jgi:hypothetical protein
VSVRISLQPPQLLRLLDPIRILKAMSLLTDIKALLGLT